MNNVEYAGFWVRVGASLIDTVLLMLVIAPILTMIYGQEYWSGSVASSGLLSLAINYVFPALAVILFWIYRSATPGKMALKLTIVDATTGKKPSTGQMVGRYFGYYVSMLPMFLGIIWVGIDKRKQGLHDKMAGTVVVKNLSAEPVQFETSD
jgi:uncharacterized RDD family membrane protein YckC